MSHRETHSHIKHFKFNKLHTRIMCWKKNANSEETIVLTYFNHWTLDFFLLPTGWSLLFFKELWTEDVLSDLTGVVREASRRLSESDSSSLKFKIFLRGLIEKNPVKPTCSFWPLTQQSACWLKLQDLPFLFWQWIHPFSFGMWSLPFWETFLRV